MKTLTALFRQDSISYKDSEGPTSKNPGGGLSTKKKYLQQALPKCDFVNAPSAFGKIAIVDVLYFSGGGSRETFDERIEKYTQAKDTLKILWTSDFEIFRWLPEDAEKILDATDVIGANSPYMFQLLSYFKTPVALLTDPINTDVKVGKKQRKRVIYSCSHIILEKGIQDVINLYQALTEAETDIQTVFIGSSETWGLGQDNLVAFDLEIDISEVANLHKESLPNPKVITDYANQAWCYISFARFETFGYGLVEALRGGCHVFASRHGAYQDKINAGVVIPLTPNTAYETIASFIEHTEPTRNDAGIQFVRDMHSFDVFRKQLRDIIGRQYGI